MSEVGLKIDKVNFEVNTGKKLPVIPGTINEASIQTVIQEDQLKKTIKINKDLPSNSISFSSEPAKNESKLLKSVVEGAKIKGTLIGAEYFVAGAAVGFGSKAAILKIVPNLALRAPVFFGAAGAIPRALVITGVSGLAGLTLGAAKGSIDGVVVNISPSRGVAMGAMALTSALLVSPALKISRTIGIAAITIAGTAGVFYGGHIYDKTRKEIN